MIGADVKEMISTVAGEYLQPLWEALECLSTAKGHVWVYVRSVDRPYPGPFWRLQSSVKAASAAGLYLEAASDTWWGRDLLNLCSEMEAAGEVALKYAEAAKKRRPPTARKLEATEAALRFHVLVKELYDEVRSVNINHRASWRKHLARQ